METREPSLEKGLAAALRKSNSKRELLLRIEFFYIFVTLVAVRWIFLTHIKSALLSLQLCPFKLNECVSQRARATTTLLSLLHRGAAAKNRISLQFSLRPLERRNSYPSRASRSLRFQIYINDYFCMHVQCCCWLLSKAIVCKTVTHRVWHFSNSAK